MGFLSDLGNTIADGFNSAADWFYEDTPVGKAIDKGINAWTNKNDTNRGRSAKDVRKQNYKEYQELNNVGIKISDMQSQQGSAMTIVNHNYVAQNDYDITAYIPEYGTLAVVNNQNTGGTWCSKYGYLEAHVTGLENGTVIKVYNDGTYDRLDLKNASEDYIDQYNKFCDGYKEARSEYRKSVRFQNLATRGYEMVQVGTNNKDSHADSFWEVFDNIIHGAAEQENKDVLSFEDWKKTMNQDWIKSVDPEMVNYSYKMYVQQNSTSATDMLAPERMIGAGGLLTVGEGLLNEKTIASVKDYAYTKQWYQAILDHSNDATTYKELYLKDPDAARDLLLEDTNLSERERQYIAYQLVANGGQDRKLQDYLINAALNTMQDLGESLDWLSNPVKGTVAYLDNKDGENWTGITNTSDTWTETIEAAYRASWENEGRQQYNYDTGFMPFDLALEIISDPEFALTKASKLFDKSVGKSLGVSDDLLKKHGILNKLLGQSEFETMMAKSETPQELGEMLAKRMPSNAEAFRTLARDYDEYQHSLTMSHALRGTIEDKNAIDAFMAIGSTNGIPWALKNLLPIAWKGGNLIFRFGEMSQESRVAYKHKIAGFASSMAKTGTDVKLDNVVEFTDHSDVNFTAIRNWIKKHTPEGYTKELEDILQLTKEDRLALFSQAYSNTVNEIKDILAKDSKSFRKFLKYDMTDSNIVTRTLSKHIDEFKPYGSISPQKQILNFLIQDAGENNMEIARLTAISKLFDDKATAQLGSIHLTDYLTRKEALDVMKKLHLEHTEKYKLLDMVHRTDNLTFTFADAPDFTKQAYDLFSEVANKGEFVDDARAALTESAFQQSFLKHGDEIKASELGTLYTPKLKEDIVADMVQTNRFYNSVINSFSVRDANTETFYNILSSADPRVYESGLRKTLDSMLKTKYSVAAYHYFTAAIDNSMAIPNDLKGVLKDKLFSESLNNACNSVFKYEDVAHINPYRIKTKSRTLAKKLINESLSMEAQASLVDKFTELGISTKNTPDVNVKRIQEIIDTMPEALNKKDLTVYIPYDIQFNEYGDVASVAIKNGDDVRVFNLLDADGVAINDATKELDRYVLDLRSEVGHAAQRPQFVGFNNHVYGLDTDAQAQLWFSKHKMQAGNVLNMGSIDIADNLRLAKYQITPINEAAVQEITSMFQQSIDDWLSAKVFTTGVTSTPDFSIKPPTFNQFEKWFMDVSLDYRELDAIGFNGKATEIYEDMKATYQAMTDAEATLAHDLGYWQIDKATNYWEAVQKLPKEIGTRKAYDAALISKYCDKVFVDGLSFGQARRLYDTLAQVEKDYKFADAHFCSTFKQDINACYKDIKTLVFENPSIAERLGIDYDSLTHILNNNSKNWVGKNTTKRKTALMLTIWDKLTDSEKLALSKNRFTVALSDPRVLKKDTEFFNPNQVLNGSIDNPSSKWNMERSLSNEYTKMQEHMTDIKAMEEIRARSSELKGELDPIMFQYRNKLRRAYNDITDTIHNLFEIYGAEDSFATITIKSPINDKDIKVGLSFGDPSFEARLDDMNPYERYWYLGIHERPLYANFNSGLQEAQTFIYNGQLRAVSSMTQEQFDVFMLYNSAGGHFVVDTTTFDAVDVDNFKRFVDNLNNNYNMKVDNGVYKFSIDYDTMMEMRKEIPYQRMNFNIMGHGATKGHKMSTNGASVLKIYQSLTAFNDSSYTFMSGLANDITTYKMLMAKFFPDEVMSKALKPKDLVGDYCCGYIGDIKNLMGTEDIKSFVSGNQLTNLINSFNRTVVKTENLWLLNEVIYKDNKFKALDNKLCAETMASIKEDGYRIIAPKLNGEVRDITDLSVAQLKSYKNVAVLRADEVQALTLKTREMAENLNTSKLHAMVKKLREFEYKYYLKFMIESTPYTGLNNIKDSTIKAIISEGAEIIPYYAKVNDLIRKSAPALMDIYKRAEVGEFDRVSTDLIDALAKYNWKYDISPEELKLVLNFKESVISSIDADQKVLLPSLRDMAFPKRVDKKTGEVLRNANGKVLRKVDPFGFNKWLFEAPEVYNRFAIYLKTIDDTGNIGKAYEAVKMSQFEYAKGKINTALDVIKPFSTFQLYNIKFWLCDVWFKEGAPRRLGHLADIFNESYTDDPAEERFWSDDMQELRAMVDTYNFKDDDEETLSKYTVYNKYKDFTGSSMTTAKQNGWIKFRDSDTLWFKSGMSWLDAYTGLESYSLGLGDDLWSPVKIGKNLINYAMNGREEQGVLNSWDALQRGDISLEDFEAAHGYEIVSYLPFATTLWYMGESMVRNVEYAERMNKDTLWKLASCMTGIFAPAREYNYKDVNLDWYKKPVGFDWYNQTDEYRKTHRYVPGVSYVPAWVYKDPATYINTVGRLQEILGGTEGAYEFMQQGGGFWFTLDNGTYKLHNYKLMIGDEETRAQLKDSLIHKFGWNDKAAEYLLDQWGEPTWKKKGRDIKNTLRYSGASLRSVDNTGYLVGKVRGSLPHNLLKRYGAHTGVRKVYAPKGSAKPYFNNNPLGIRVSAGKNVQYSTFTTKRKQMGHDPQMFSKQYQTTVRWHHRQRDIYKDNYAKYGASRMAMEQNLKNYSNRSITEMRRTNQNLRYADIHRHTRW